MVTSPSVSKVEEYDLNSDSIWEELYPLLKSFAHYFVYTSNVSSWRGQENDIVEDIVQETGQRIIKRAQKTARGEALPIQSLKSMLFTVAHNYCKDLCRHDRRLLRMQTLEVYSNTENQANLAEISVENVYQEVLFNLIVHEVVTFPKKQRQAVLIDLANRMHFSEQPTPLQQAFLNVGISLQEYKQVLPSNPKERSRHTALVNYAYKRIAELPQVQEYISLV